jgi:hypothetical protein
MDVRAGGVVNDIRVAIDQYLHWNKGVRSINWNRDNGYVLRAWAEEMSTIVDKLSDITTPILQVWLNTKLKTLKVQTARHNCTKCKPS